MGLNSPGRISMLRQKLVERGLDGIMVSQPENRFYLSGFGGSAGYLFITAEAALLATDFRYIDQSKAEAPDYEVIRISGKAEGWLPDTVRNLGLNRLGFEAGHAVVSFHRQVTDAIAKAGLSIELVPVDGMVESLRTVKEPEEIAQIEKAVEISDQAMGHIASALQEGMTELDAAWIIERYMREHGSQTLPFEVIVQSGPNSALPHARPSTRRIGLQEPIVIDIGAKVGGYASDLTRTLCLGTPDATFRKVYDVVLGAQLAALELVKEKMTGEVADGMARTIIKEAGYGDAFGHSLGHGVGLAVHEGPTLGPNSSEVLTGAMVFSIEPGIYLPGWGGVRIEDLVTIDGGRVRVLSKAPKVDRH